MMVGGWVDEMVIGTLQEIVHGIHHVQTDPASCPAVRHEDAAAYHVHNVLDRSEPYQLAAAVECCLVESSYYWTVAVGQCLG